MTSSAQKGAAGMKEPRPLTAGKQLPGIVPTGERGLYSFINCRYNELVGKLDRIVKFQLFLPL